MKIQEMLLLNKKGMATKGGAENILYVVIFAIIVIQFLVGALPNIVSGFTALNATAGIPAFFNAILPLLFYAGLIFLCVKLFLGGAK